MVASFRSQASHSCEHFLPRSERAPISLANGSSPSCCISDPFCLVMFPHLVLQKHPPCTTTPRVGIQLVPIHFFNNTPAALKVLLLSAPQPGVPLVEFRGYLPLNTHSLPVFTRISGGTPSKTGAFVCLFLHATIVYLHERGFWRTFFCFFSRNKL